MDEIGGLFVPCDVLRTLRYELNWLGGAENVPHDAGLNGPHDVTHLGGEQLAAAVLVSDVNLAIHVALRLDPVLAELAFDEIHRGLDGDLDGFESRSHDE